MRVLDGELILSPSDLTGFAACAHLTHLELRAARGEIDRPERTDPLLDVLSRRGFEHEQRKLADAHADGGTVRTIPAPENTRVDLTRRAADTEAAMRAGVDVIYQAVFFDEPWAGYADFLWKVERRSDLGSWSYEVADAKLARSVKAAAVLQCCAYSEAVGRIQGVEPEHLHVLTGDGETHTFRVADCAAYYRRLKADLEATVSRPIAPVDEPPATYPVPVEHCAVCRWNEVCSAKRRADDHLSLVADITRPQTRRLEEVGVLTREALAVATPDDRPTRMVEATFERLHAQAALQVKGDRCTPPLFELLPLDRDDERPCGLAALPAPSPGDVFLDLEGDPYVDGGLEYLFGVVLPPADGDEPEYRAFWGHDRLHEKQAFEAVIDLIVARRMQHPGMHVYHYHHYEPSAIRRLMGTHGTREHEVDDLLRSEAFIDLFQVVRHALRLSTESYSLKQVEKLYMTRGPGEVMDAGGSIVAYENYLLRGDNAILEEIRAYNEDDCNSTRLLRDWLEGQRALVESEQGPITRPVARGRDTGDLEEQLDTVDALAADLTAGVPDDRAQRSEEAQACWLLAQLLHWHRREEKPKWWRYFDRVRPDRTVDEFIADRECIGGLQYEGVVDQIDRSLVHRFRFEPQDHRFEKGATAFDPATENRVGAVVEVGDDWITLKRARSTDVPVPRNLIPKEFYGTRDQKDALIEIGSWVRDRGIDAAGPHRAARDLLLRRGPRRAQRGEPLVLPRESVGDAACRLVVNLDGECLAIQGPPGTGKTYTGARMALALLCAGKRVGITAQSHAVINNFLSRVVEEAAKLSVDVPAIQKADDDDHCGFDGVGQAPRNEDVRAALDAGEALLAAGTSWLWCDPGMREAVDVLFVDEAGQRSLADVVAASVGARNVVLLGDPQQLAQVSQGSHPDGAEKSALAHLLGDHQTMPPGLGLFLDTTWRMHPAVCQFISNLVYEGKLAPLPGLERQVVSGDDCLGGAGLRSLPVMHEGNSTCSPEEAAEVARLVEALIGRLWTDANGATHPLTEKSVLVVAPYNAQVAELRRHVRDGVTIGTVDKFQGQEAPITIYSMASSTSDDAPRGMNFLYDIHRLNVAVSRARSVSIVVCSPELQRVMCSLPGQIRLANVLCAYSEAADGCDRTAVPESSLGRVAETEPAIRRAR